MDELAKQHWIIRDARPDDVNFIYATWLNSYRSDSWIGASCFKEVFFRNYSRVIDRILAHPECSVRVAARKDDESVIFGYCVYEPEALHYVFVKECFRKWGVAKSLVEPIQKSLKYFTHRTHTATPIIGRCLGFQYNPFLLFQQAHPPGDPSDAPEHQATKDAS